MRVSTTERQTYKRCRRKWDYSSYNRQSLSPVLNAPALDLGSLVHLVLAEWTNEPTLDPVALYTTRSQGYFQKLISVYTERVGCAPSTAELQPNMEAILLGKNMLENYQAHWHTPLPAGFTLLQNELSLVQPVPGTEHCECSKINCEQRCIACAYADPHFKDECDLSCDCLVRHELECTFDGVMADEAGDLYIIERKTFSRTPSIDELNNNDQFLAYQWALTMSLQQAGSSQQVVGVAYDGLLKKPKPSGVHRTLPDLFLRRLLLRNQHELEEFGQLLAQELNEMASPQVPIYKTVPPVMGCQRWECAYIDMCHATSKGEPVDDMLKMFVKVDRKSHLDSTGHLRQQDMEVES